MFNILKGEFNNGKFIYKIYIKVINTRAETKMMRFYRFKHKKGIYRYN